MKLFYDLHIHSALSPCAEEEMTPFNIVGMAKLKGLDMIAISDHNSIWNIPAAMEAGRQMDLLVLPAMELETREEIHMLLLFSRFSDCKEFYEAIRHRLPKIKNRQDIYGPQLIFNELDEVVGKEENLLSVAADLSLEEATFLVNSFGGVAIPAHIDRPSYSILSNLGFFPEKPDFSCVEVQNPVRIEELSRFCRGQRIITNSDAHTLGLISEREYFIEVSEMSANGVIDVLKNEISTKN